MANRPWCGFQGKFTKEDIENIFKLKNEGLSVKEIAVMYDYTHRNISKILAGERYRQWGQPFVDSRKRQSTKFSNELIGNIKWLAQFIYVPHIAKYFKMDFHTCFAIAYGHTYANREYYKCPELIDIIKNMNYRVVKKEFRAKQDELRKAEALRLTKNL